MRAAGTRKVLLAVVLASGLTSALAACGQVEQRNVCAHVAALGTAVQDLKEAVPKDATTGQLQSLVDDAVARLDQVQASSEDPYSTGLSELQDALTNFQSSLNDAGTKASAAARPLIEDALDTLADQYAIAQQQLDVTCPTP